MPHCFHCPKARIQAPWSSWRGQPPWPPDLPCLLSPSSFASLLSCHLEFLVLPCLWGLVLAVPASRRLLPQFIWWCPFSALQDTLLKARSSGILLGCSHSTLYSPHCCAYTGKGRSRQSSVYMSISSTRWKAPKGQGLITRSLVPSL